VIGIEELMQIFGHFDGDHNGRIDRGEFKRLMAGSSAGPSTRAPRSRDGRRR
jgi:Ca2+-binding EF-hand superfamily protein